MKKQANEEKISIIGITPTSGEIENLKQVKGTDYFHFNTSIQAEMQIKALNLFNLCYKRVTCLEFGRTMLYFLENGYKTIISYNI